MSTARKSHTKSRNGCQQCKRKKVKCDEKVPCSNCSRQDSACSLASSLPDPPPASSPVRVDPPGPAAHFALQDFQLFHHFMTSTSNCWRTDNESNLSWVPVVPALATRHLYLLHEVLAVSAIHLHRLHPNDTTNWKRLGQEHQARSLSLFRAALESPNLESEAPALFVCSALNVNYYFTAVEDPKSLLFSEDPLGPPEWLFPVRGCGTLIKQFTDHILAGPMSPMLRYYVHPWSNDYPLGTCESDEHLRLLGTRLQSLTTPEDQKVYKPALDLLRRCFIVSDQQDAASIKSAALGFPANAPDEFVQAMSCDKAPSAMVLMAYWCVLLHRMDKRWWLQDHCNAEHILDAVESLLPLEFIELIQWPLQIVRHKLPHHFSIGDV